MWLDKVFVYYFQVGQSRSSNEKILSSSDKTVTVAASLYVIHSAITKGFRFQLFKGHYFDLYLQANHQGCS